MNSVTESATVYPTVLSRLLTAALDELDYGVVLLVDGTRIAHLNGLAIRQLDGVFPLQRAAGELRARFARDIAPLHDAVEAAATLGLRKLLAVGSAAERTNLSIAPLEPPCGERRAVLVVLGKLAVSEALSVLGFARSHGLTGAETRLLEVLVRGREPTRAADDLGVAISTVRTQIGSIRQKTGASSLRELVQQVALLPPLASALGRTNSID